MDPDACLTIAETAFECLLHRHHCLVAPWALFLEAEDAITAYRQWRERGGGEGRAGNDTRAAVLGMRLIALKEEMEEVHGRERDARSCEGTA